MVLDSIVANILNDYLGKYIQNLDGDNLNISLLSGNVVLNDLTLKPESLFDLDLPFEIKAGYIGKLTLLIPWTSIYTNPVIALVEGVYVLVGPLTDSSYNEELESARLNAKKQNMLADLEKNKKKEVSKEESKKSQSFTEKLTATIINNVQVTVRNVHCRYEDSSSIPDRPIAIGVTLKNLLAQTVNEEWDISQVDASTSTMRKLVKLEELSLYCDNGISDLVSNHINSGDWKNILFNAVRDGVVFEEPLDYVLRPVTTQARLSYDKSPEASLSLPKLIIDVAMEQIALQLSKTQYAATLFLAQAMESMEVNMQFRKYRPTEPVHNHASQWWKYAYNVVLEETIRPFSWERIRSQRVKYRHYKNLYKQKLEKSYEEKKEHQKKLKNLEDELDVTSIVLAREQAKLEFIKEAPEKERKKKDSSPSKGNGWLPWNWFDSSDTEDELEVEDDEEDQEGIFNQLSAKDKEELYKAIGYLEDEDERQENISVEYVERKFNFHLGNCTISLKKGGGDILNMSFKDVSLLAEQRPAGDAIHIGFHTTSMLVSGRSVSGAMKPIITPEKSVAGKSSGDTKIFSLDFETNPLGIGADFSADVAIEPIEIIYNENAISEVITFFMVPNTAAIEGLKMAAVTSLGTLTEISRAGLQYSIENHKTIHLEIDMKSPYLVIPEYGDISKPGYLLIADFGSLKITSELQDTVPALEELTNTEIEQSLYDKFNIALNDIQLMFCHSDADWQTAHEVKESEYHIVPCVAVNIALYLSVKPDYKQLPKQKMEAVLPSLKLKISDTKLKKLLQFAKNLPLPKDMNTEVDSYNVVIPSMDKQTIKPQIKIKELKKTKKSLAQRKQIVEEVYDAVDAGLLQQQPSLASEPEVYYSASDHADETIEEWANVLDIPDFEEESETNHTSILLRIIIREFVLSVSRVQPPMDEMGGGLPPSQDVSSLRLADLESLQGESEYLTFRIDSIYTDMALTDYGFTTQVTLGSLQVIDKIHTGLDGKYLHLLSSASRDPLVSVLLRRVSPKCPEFARFYNSMEQALSIKLTALSLVVHREALLELQQYLNNLTQSLSMSTGSDTKAEETDEKKPSKEPSKDEGTKQETAPIQRGVIKTYVLVKLTYLSVSLCNVHSDLADLYVRGLEAVVSFRRSKTMVRARLQDLTVENSSLSKIYTKILSIEDQSVFDFKFVMFNQAAISKSETKLANSLDVDYSLKLRIGRLHFVFLRTFINDLVDFFNAFVEPEILASARDASERVVRQQVEDIGKNKKKIQLNISIRGPVIVLPQNLNSSNALVAHLGDIMAKNTFTQGSLSGSQAAVHQDLIDHTSLELNAMQISRVVILANQALGARRLIVEPFSLHADFKRLLKMQESHELLYWLSGRLDSIKINLGEQDLVTILNALQQTLSDEEEDVSGEDAVGRQPMGRNIVESDSSLAIAPGDISEGDIAAEDVWKQTLVDFVMEGVELELFTNEPRLDKKGNSLNLREEKYGLSRFSLKDCEASVSLYSNQDVEVKVKLASVALNDIRKNSPLAVKSIFWKYIKEMERSSTSSSSDLNDQPMVELTYLQTDKGKFQKIEVCVEGIRLNIYVHYILAIANFFTSVQSKRKAPQASRQASSLPPAAPPQPPPSTPTAPAPPSNLIVHALVKNPEIVLFADSTTKDSHVLVLRTEILMDYVREIDASDRLNAEINDLQIVSCFYSDPKGTSKRILFPCQITLGRLMTVNKKEDISIAASDLDLHMSHTTIHTVRAIVDDITTLTQRKLSETVSVGEEEKNLWTPRAITVEDFVIPNVGMTVVDFMPGFDEEAIGTVHQTLKAEIPKINVVYELEKNREQVPVLSLQSEVEVDMKNWSQKLRLNAALKLSVAYYNEKLSVWEYLIEPIPVRENEYRQWELIFRVAQEPGLPITGSRENYPLPGDDTTDGANLNSSFLSHAEIQEVVSESESDSDSDTETEEEGIGSYQSSTYDDSSNVTEDVGSDVGKLDDGGDGGARSDEESDKENVFEKITDFFASMLSSSDSEDEDEVDGPQVVEEEVIAASSAASLHAAPPGSAITGLEGETEEEFAGALANYVVIQSKDSLPITITPTAVSIVQGVVEVMTKPPKRAKARDRLPQDHAFKLVNSTGLQATATAKKSFRSAPFSENIDLILPKNDESDIISLTEVDGLPNDNSQDKANTLSGAFTRANNVTLDPEHFVYDVHEVKYLTKDIMTSFENEKEEYMTFKIEGFSPLPNVSFKRERKVLFPLSPSKNSTTYSIVHDVSIGHGKKTVTIRSPLQIVNHLPMALKVYYKSLELQVLEGASIPGEDEKEWTLLGTIGVESTFNIPLYVAYHCGLYLCPEKEDYFISEAALRWQDMLASSESRQNIFSCKPKLEKECPFYFKVVCNDAILDKTPTGIPSGTPNYVLNLYPPLIVHNYLPYSLFYSLEESSLHGKSQPTQLEAGNNRPLYSVNPVNKERLCLQIFDYLMADWQGIVHLSEFLKENETIVMDTNDQDHDDERFRQLFLSIRTTYGTSMDLFVYSPYWLVNKTELPLEIRGSGSRTVYENQTSQNPMLFMFGKKRKKKAKIRVLESKWSKDFSLDTVGSSGVVVCKDKEHDRLYQFWVEISMSYLALTKILTIMPYFLVRNKTETGLSFLEEGMKAPVWVDIGPDECIPFWPATDSMKMFVKLENSQLSSQHFRVDKPHSTVLRMMEGAGLHVEVLGGTEGPTTITFSDYTQGSAPVLLVNLCNDIFIKANQRSGHSVQLLMPYQSLLYTWDDPVAERILTWNLYNRNKPPFQALISKDGYGKETLSVDSIRRSSQQGDGNYVDGDVHSIYSSEDEDEARDDTDGGFSHPLSKRTERTTIYWVSYLEGLQRVLLYTQDSHIVNSIKSQNEAKEPVNLELFLSFRGASLSLVNNLYEEVTFVTLSSGAPQWEIEVKKNKWKMASMELSGVLDEMWIKKKENPQQKNDTVQVDFDTMELLEVSKPIKRHLKRYCPPAVWLQYRQSEHYFLIDADIQKLQIDNQLRDAFFTTVLYPAPLPKSVLKKTGPRPFIELMLLTRKTDDKKADIVKYFKVLVQEANIKVDKGFVLSLLDVYDSITEDAEPVLQLKLDLEYVQQTLGETVSYLESGKPYPIYYEFLHLSPLKFRVSVSLSGTAHTIGEESSNLAIKSDIIDFFLSSIGTTLTDIRDVEIKLAYFERTNMILSQEQLMSEVRGHYVSQGVKQSYRLLLGLDVLGNPYGLFKDYTEGIHDLFYEPYQGLVLGPGEFAEGLARGVQSLLEHTVGGTAGAASRITGSLGRAIAALTFDDDFIRRREEKFYTANTLPESLYLAGQGFLMGIVNGLSGIVLKPVQGAQEEGIKGFFKGIGKGLLGLITHPTVGVIDLFSLVFNGIQRATDMGEDVVSRIRQPRFINPNEGIKPWSRQMAMGSSILYSLNKGKYWSTDIFYAYIAVKYDKPDTPDIVLITNRRIILLEEAQFWGGWEVEWQDSFETIVGMPSEVENKVVYRVQEPNRPIDPLSTSTKEIVCDTEDSRRVLCAKLARALSLYRAEKFLQLSNEIRDADIKGEGKGK